jgi:hypothetical protein
MTIEEMKEALMSGKDPEALIKEFNTQLKQAQNEVTAEKEKNIKLDTARRKLAFAIADYAEALYGKSEIDITEIVILLKNFESEQSKQREAIDDFEKLYDRFIGNKKSSNEKKSDTSKKKDLSDEDLINSFLKLWNL